MREFEKQHTYHLGMLDKSLENGDDSGTVFSHWVYHIVYKVYNIRYIICTYYPYDIIWIYIYMYIHIIYIYIYPYYIYIHLYYPYYIICIYIYTKMDSYVPLLNKIHCEMT